MTDVVGLETIAVHEAGHAVMRWRRCLPATEITASNDGGLCAGTGGSARAEDVLLVALAGFAAEAGCMGGPLDLAVCRADDFDRCRQILGEAEWLRIRATPACEIFVDSVDDTLQRWFDRACDELLPDVELVRALADRLEDDGRVSESLNRRPELPPDDLQSARLMHDHPSADSQKQESLIC